MVFCNPNSYNSSFKCFHRLCLRGLRVVAIALTEVASFGSVSISAAYKVSAVSTSHLLESRLSSQHPNLNFIEAIH